MRTAKGVVRAADIPALSRTSFPLCMRVMYEAVHAEHHLRHSGRMELGLFLKVARSSTPQGILRDSRGSLDALA